MECGMSSTCTGPSSGYIPNVSSPSRLIEEIAKAVDSPFSHLLFGASGHGTRLAPIFMTFKLRWLQVWPRAEDV